MIQAALTIFGMISGPILGLFILGIIYPWTNYKVSGSDLLTGFNAKATRCCKLYCKIQMMNNL